MLEVTESIVLADGARTREPRRDLAAGIGLALDDFGTGHSSLSHLRRLKLDAIKLDRGFIAAEPASMGDAILTAVAAWPRGGRPRAGGGHRDRCRP